MPLELLDYALVALAAMAAGAINALAGGGTLISFPMLTAIGIPAVAANVTNTVALCPGYFGATLAQVRDLDGQKQRLWWLLPAAVLGGITGGVILLNTEERVFRELVPYLILMAAALLAFQPQLRQWMVRRLQQPGATHDRMVPATLMVFLASVYGGYFGAGLSVIVLATLALMLEDTLTRLNAMKQFISFCVNVAAALFFVFSGEVIWPVALVMAVGALMGGMLGGRIAGRISPVWLRWLVVTLATIVALIYLFR